MYKYNLCIVKPNGSTFSETFIQAHIQRLGGNKKVLYGGSFPIYEENGKLLIRSKLDLLSYLIQKKLFKRQEISVRTQAFVYYLKEQKIDIVLAEYGMVGAMIAKACQLAYVPLVIHFHGADAHHRATIAAHDYKKAFAYASAIVGVSDDMVQQLAKLGAPTDKLFLIPYGIDTHFFKSLPIQNNPPNFLSIGRFVEKKSPTSLVKAFQIVTNKIPEAHLWMVGNGALLDKTKKLAQQLGIADKITFMGVLASSEIALLMEKMRCFVQHSVIAMDGDMEGTPLAILEASSSGLPIVSTKHAGIKQSVIDAKTGFLVDEYDIEGMAERMIQFAASAELAATMGANARQHILRNYQIDRQIAKLDQVIQNCLSLIPVNG